MKVYRTIPSLLQHTLWLVLCLVRLFRRRVVFKGRENLKLLPVNKGVIFASNHIAHLDPVYVTLGLDFFSRNFPMYYVSRPPGGYDHMGLLGKYLYGGELFKFWGAYPAPKGTGDLATSLRYHHSILQNGGSVLIFPEGKIIGVEDTARARPGVAYLAESTGATIVPTAILRSKKDIIVIYGKPFTFAELPEKAGDDRHKIAAEEIMRRVYALNQKE